ncbi:MAG: SDR family oxidoreductase [Oscillospiraceae bacterium]|nr:SDR family oxidoreductase [Oscillospiraceae bacterium]
MNKFSSLQGKTAVITGGSGVLCSAFAYALAQQGMNVAVLGRTLSKLEAVRDKINELGGKGLAVVCDVVDKNSVAAAKKAVNDAFGKTDILVNGAGGNHPRGNTTKEFFEDGDLENPDVVSFFDLDSENFNYVFDLNIVGTLIPTQVFMPDMLGREGCTVINIASMGSYHPLTKVSAYSAAKAAIANFTEWLAVHFAKSGIRVNAIAPGWFQTNQNRTLLLNEDGSLTERSKKVIAHTPMDRFGVPEDLIGTLLYLADDTMSGFVTGAVIPVDGGFQAYFGV